MSIRYTLFKYVVTLEDFADKIRDNQDKKVNISTRGFNYPNNIENKVFLNFQNSGYEKTLSKYTFKPNESDMSEKMKYANILANAFLSANKLEELGFNVTINDEPIEETKKILQEALDIVSQGPI